MKRTESSCWHCGKADNLFKPNAELGILIEHADKTVFGHATCSDFKNVPVIPEKEQREAANI